MQAFGGGVPTTKMLAVYLGGSVLAAVSPTPGGLGALEAALVAGPTGVGPAAGPSVAAVLVDRFVTYWVPVLRGAVPYRRLRSRSVYERPVPRLAQRGLSGRGAHSATEKREEVK